LYVVVSQRPLRSQAGHVDSTKVRRGVQLSFGVAVKLAVNRPYLA